MWAEKNHIKFGKPITLHIDIRTILYHARTLMLSTVAVNTDKISSIKISIDNMRDLMRVRERAAVQSLLEMVGSRRRLVRASSV